MTIIRASSIQCVADEASASEYRYADNVTVLAYSQKEADVTLEEWLRAQAIKRHQEAQDDQPTLPL